MPKAALTDLFLRSAKSETQTDFWDTKTAGFGVRIGKHAKTFVVKMDNRRVTIGTYPALSLQEARKKAMGVKAEDIKPADKRTFIDAYEKYKETLSSKRPRTARDYKRMLDKYFLPTLGKKRLSDITYEHITDLTKDVKRSEGAHALATAAPCCVERKDAHRVSDNLQDIRFVRGAV